VKVDGAPCPRTRYHASHVLQKMCAILLHDLYGTLSAKITIINAKFHLTWPVENDKELAPIFAETLARFLTTMVSRHDITSVYIEFSLHSLPWKQSLGGDVIFNTLVGPLPH
jgi:hypothetical protein